MRAGIVGAGISGASCAGVLSAAGWDVEIFDKARGAGGRLSTRRMNNGWVSLGSPFISAKRNPFLSQLGEWVQQGWLEAVHDGVMRTCSTASLTPAQLQNHYRPRVEPSQLVRNLMGSARLHTESRVALLTPRTLILENGETHGDFDCVICSVPTPQAIALLKNLPRLQNRLQHDTRYRPLWSFITRWEGGPPADVIQFDDEHLEIAVRQFNGKGFWVVHSTHAFAEAYLEVSNEEARLHAASSLMNLLALPRPADVDAAHLWRMALPAAQQDGLWLYDRKYCVALIGDGIAGAGVEQAWESGTRFGQALVQDDVTLSQ